MNTNFAKLVAIAIVGSVVKALFDNRPVNHFHYDKPATEVEKDEEV